MKITSAPSALGKARIANRYMFWESEEGKPIDIDSREVSDVVRKGEACCYYRYGNRQLLQVLGHTSPPKFCRSRRVRGCSGRRNRRRNHFLALLPPPVRLARDLLSPGTCPRSPRPRCGCPCRRRRSRTEPKW